MYHKYLRLAVFVISLLTLIAGLIQAVRPTLILSIVQGESSPSAAHFFAIVGMFMSLFGGLMLQGLYSPYPNSIIVRWCALQKAGASLAVLIGIIRGIFSPLAGLISGFDFLSAIILFSYLSQVRSAEDEDNVFAGTAGGTTGNRFV